MGAFTTRAKNNGRHSSCGQKGRIHPGGSAPNCGLTTGWCRCLATYYLDNQFVLGYFERLAHKGRSHRCFKIWIGPRYMIKDTLYLGFNTFRGFTWNGAAFYAKLTMIGITREFLTPSDKGGVN